MIGPKPKWLLLLHFYTSLLLCLACQAFCYPFKMLTNSKWLLMCAYAIGVFDLLTALVFFLVSLKTVCDRLSWLGIFAVTFGFFWLTMIVMLIVGIHGRNPKCVYIWIAFSCVGILFEMGLLAYAFFQETSFQMGLLKNGILLVLGMLVECTFLYIVYRFYVQLKYCEACLRPLDSNRKRPKHKVQLDCINPKLVINNQIVGRSLRFT